MNFIKNILHKRKMRKNTQELECIEEIIRDYKMKYLEEKEKLQQNLVVTQQKLINKTEECIQLKDKQESAKYKKAAKV